MGTKAEIIDEAVADCIDRYTGIVGAISPWNADYAATVIDLAGVVIAQLAPESLGPRTKRAFGLLTMVVDERERLAGKPLH